MYEYELEALPELEGEWESEWEGEWESEWEGELESEEFFRSLAQLGRRGIAAARQGWGWLTTPGSQQRRAALGAAQGALRTGLPALGGAIGTAIAPGVGTVIGTTLGGAAGYGASSLLPERMYESEFEWELEGELSPLRRVYPDALMEHLGHAAATAQREAEAEAFLGALVPLAARLAPHAASTIMRAAPGLIGGVAGAARTLRRSPATRPLVRTIPTIVRRTAANIAQQVAQGQPVSPPAAVRTLARQTARIIGSPQRCVQAWQRSQALDRRYHQLARAA